MNTERNDSLPKSENNTNKQTYSSVMFFRFALTLSKIFLSSQNVQPYNGILIIQENHTYTHTKKKLFATRKHLSKLSIEI